MAKYSVLIGEDAKVEFLEIPFPFRRQVNQWINKLKANPHLEAAEAIAGSEGFRVDVAGWRILYEVEGTEVRILAFRRVADPPS